MMPSAATTRIAAQIEAPTSSHCEMSISVARSNRRCHHAAGGGAGSGGASGGAGGAGGSGGAAGGRGGEGGAGPQGGDGAPSGSSGGGECGKGSSGGGGNDGGDASNPNLAAASGSARCRSWPSTIIMAKQPHMEWAEEAWR